MVAAVKFVPTEPFWKTCYLLASWCSKGNLELPNHEPRKQVFQTWASGVFDWKTREILTSKIPELLSLTDWQVVLIRRNCVLILKSNGIET